MFWNKIICKIFYEFLQGLSRQFFLRAPLLVRPLLQQLCGFTTKSSICNMYTWSILSKSWKMFLRLEVMMNRVFMSLELTTKTKKHVRNYILFYTNADSGIHIMKNGSYFSIFIHKKCHTVSLGFHKRHSLYFFFKSILTKRDDTEKE